MSGDLAPKGTSGQWKATRKQNGSCPVPGVACCQLALRQFTKLPNTLSEIRTHSFRFHRGAVHHPCMYRKNMANLVGHLGCDATFESMHSFACKQDLSCSPAFTEACFNAVAFSVASKRKTFLMASRWMLS